jgi:uncharacterized damage-inducible protein DinB
MSTIEACQQVWSFHRSRTLGLLDRIEQTGRADEILAWRPGPGRAHIAWQLMHIGITEELFATERLTDQTPDFPEFKERFRGGSTPDDEIPTAPKIREVLEHSRAHLLRTLEQFSNSDLESIPTPWTQERGWTLATTLHVIGWHEAHHQGQAHLTFNLWNASQV